MSQDPLDDFHRLAPVHQVGCHKPAQGMEAEFLDLGALAQAGHETPAGSIWLVTNGFIRDTGEIKEMGFPIYASGRKPSDCRGRIEYEDHNCKVTIGEVAIRPGDLIIADDDGIIVVPSDIVEEVLKRAEALNEKHEWIHSQLKAGRPASEVMETYSRELLKSQSNNKNIM